MLDTGNGFIFDSSDIEYLREEVYPNKRLKIKPYDFYRAIPINHIRQLCVEEGLYCIPTAELIEFLKSEMGDNKTIEVGSGNGAICRALGIVGTDSFIQRDALVRQYYDNNRQGIVTYDEDLLRYDAIEAVRRLRPHTVIASWVTHKYISREHYRGGFIYGVKEERILEKVNKYIFIGNKKTHRHKPILSKKHRTVEVPWLVSRVMNSEDVIWIWEK